MRSHGQMTVSELATAVNVTPIAVRHHLTALQAEGMIEVRDERHGVGRPRQVYKLTADALERNSSRYYQFTNLLLDQMKEHLPPEMVAKLLAEVASSMAGVWQAELDALPLPRRLDRLVELLTREGFVARVESTGAGQYCLTELACPYSRISLSHPEICALDAAMISRALGAPVERTSCIRTGSDSCTYLIGAVKKEPGNG
ncbi:MAG: ArsR family transcriptional regulator [Anaerolineales bacterium]|nr:ArsR family transcriptional regulator [Anaerolineales bacterium]